jgi:ABC-type proline/glycine betaine transport system permease subunit
VASTGVHALFLLIALALALVVGGELAIFDLRSSKARTASTATREEPEAVEVRQKGA